MDIHEGYHITRKYTREKEHTKTAREAYSHSNKRGEAAKLLSRFNHAPI